MISDSIASQTDDLQRILENSHETFLENGLKSVVIPNSATGSFVCDIYYKGGSSADPSGYSGISHFLEHMLFNGTSSIPKGILDRLVLKLAGQHNAETGTDFTHYWSRLPKHSLELALAIEADRMTGALLNPTDFEREKNVIIEEEARYSEQPFEKLMTLMLAEVFSGHPYANPTIGNPDELKQITLDALTNHYRKTYFPENACLLIVGDCSPARTFKLIEKHFGHISSTHTSLTPKLKKPQPASYGGKRILLDSSETIPRGFFIWPAPGPFEFKSRPWVVLSSILGGGRASRLWNALVEESQISSYVNISLSEERLGGYLLLEVELNPSVEPAAAEDLVFQTLQRLASQGPSPAELQRIAIQRSVATAWARQQSSALAAALGPWALFSDFQKLLKAWDRDSRVNASDLMKVSSLLTPENCLIGWTIPEKKKNKSKLKSPDPNEKSFKPLNESQPIKSKEISKELSRLNLSSPDLQSGLSPVFAKLAQKTLAHQAQIHLKSKPQLYLATNRMVFLAECSSNQYVCAIELRWHTGWLDEWLPGLANLTARLCEEVVDTPSGKTFAESLEDLGASVDCGPGGIGIEGRSLDIDHLVTALNRMIRLPDISKVTFNHVKKRILNELLSDLDDPAFKAESLLRNLVYDDGIGSEDIRGTPESLKKITLQDVRKFHSRFYHASNAMLGITVEGKKDRLFKKLDTLFSDFPNGENITPVLSESLKNLIDSPLPSHRIRLISSSGTQTHVIMGHRTVPRTHDDWPALQVLEVILGAGPGLSDLLSRKLREELALVYNISMAATEGAWHFPGLLKIAFSCDPADAIQAEQTVIDILNQAKSGLISDDELLEARDYLVNSWFMSMESADDRLSIWLDSELDDWDLTLPPLWIRKIANLTPNQIRAVAARQICPDKLQIVRCIPS